jgi:hypothetical protein
VTGRVKRPTEVTTKPALQLDKERGSVRTIRWLCRSFRCHAGGFAGGQLSAGVARHPHRSCSRAARVAAELQSLFGAAVLDQPVERPHCGVLPSQVNPVATRSLAIKHLLKHKTNSCNVSSYVYYVRTYMQIDTETVLQPRGSTHPAETGAALPCRLRNPLSARHPQRRSMGRMAVTLSAARISGVPGSRNGGHEKPTKQPAPRQLLLGRGSFEHGAASKGRSNGSLLRAWANCREASG